MILYIFNRPFYAESRCFSIRNTVKKKLVVVIGAASLTLLALRFPFGFSFPFGFAKGKTKGQRALKASLWLSIGSPEGRQPFGFTKGKTKGQRGRTGCFAVAGAGEKKPNRPNTGPTDCRLADNNQKDASTTFC